MCSSISILIYMIIVWALSDSLADGVKLYCMLSMLCAFNFIQGICLIFTGMSQLRFNKGNWKQMPLKKKRMT